MMNLTEGFSYLKNYSTEGNFLDSTISFIFEPAIQILHI
jgi:hypothetical protein